MCQGRISRSESLFCLFGQNRKESGEEEETIEDSPQKVDPCFAFLGREEESLALRFFVGSNSKTPMRYIYRRLRKLG